MSRQTAGYEAGPSSRRPDDILEGKPIPTSRASKRQRSPNVEAEIAMSATQAERAAEQDDGPEAPEMDELYVALRSDVVGIQHYNGMVGPGEKVMLQRDPLNAYDTNAVKVLNARNVQVGHIPRAVAARLAPLMDGKSITVEGEMKSGNMTSSLTYKLKIMVSIYGAPSARRTLEPQLVWATPGQLGFEHMRQLQAEGLLDETLNPAPPGKRKVPAKVNMDIHGSSNGGTGSTSTGPDPAMQAMLDSLKKLRDDEKQANDVMDTLTASFDVAKIALHPSPPSIADGTLYVDLLPHQSQALQWMIEHENPKLPTKPEDNAVQFWKKSKGSAGRPDYWLNAATMTPQQEDPDVGKGGIIADGMGLGKTLTILSLVLATMKKNTQGFSKSTLIVCPLSVLSNWSKQIEDHIVPGHLSIHAYHGDGRKITAAALATKDIVITTYQTVAGESSVAAEGSKSKAKKAKVADGPLSKVKWKRIVCDEGHVLRNPRAKMSQAMCALEADTRWVCTGTPIINSPADLGSLLQFLKVCKPLDQSAYFKSLLLRKLTSGDPGAAKLLQALIGSILLRRTKDSTDKNGRKLVELPPLEYFQVSVELDEVTRKLYDDVKAESARRFQESLQSGEGANNVLAMLTRMRQLCLSASLIPSDYLDDLRAPPKDTAAQAVDSLSAEEKARLVAKLRVVVAELEECPICYDVISNPRITTCAHAFCLDCITEVLRRSSLCPLDRRQLPPGSLIELPPDDAGTDKDDFDDEPEQKKLIKSAKIEELVKLLRLFPATDKSLVFSQFTGFLTYVGAALDAAGISYCRFEGSMPAKTRRETIARFQCPIPETGQGSRQNPQVMLISLKSGAVGLNLTAASNVFLMDPWWQSSIESQAIDRAHRMGQQKPVKVFQLIAEDTVESKVLEIQSRKDALITQAFAKSTKESAQAKKAARQEEFKELFDIKTAPGATSSRRN